MRETFIVKHAVGGKIYIDTGKRPVDYKLEQEGDGGWRFTIRMPEGEAVEEILRLRQELNVFVFREEEGKPTVKTWYYVGEGPVTYERSAQVLTITAASKIEYVPDTYLS